MTKPKLSEIANTYSLILCDIWGVVHNGNNIFPDAINTLLAYLDVGGISASLLMRPGGLK